MKWFDFLRDVLSVDCDVRLLYLINNLANRLSFHSVKLSSLDRACSRNRSANSSYFF